jgi:hypothetical protein
VIWFCLIAYRLEMTYYAVFQLMAMVCDISRTAVLDLLLVNTQLDPLSTLYYMAPASAFLISIG